MNLEEAMKDEGVRFGLNITRPVPEMLNKFCEIKGISKEDAAAIVEDIKEKGAFTLEQE